MSVRDLNVTFSATYLLDPGGRNEMLQHPVVIDGKREMSHFLPNPALPETLSLCGNLYQFVHQMAHSHLCESPDIHSQIRTPQATADPGLICLDLDLLYSAAASRHWQIREHQYHDCPTA